VSLHRSGRSSPAAAARALQSADGRQQRVGKRRTNERTDRWTPPSCKTPPFAAGRELNKVLTNGKNLRNLIAREVAYLAYP